jgi:hypothetical protein
VPLKKREIKNLRKEQQVFDLFMKGERASDIQKATKVDKSTCNMLIDRMRRTFTKL